MKPILFNTEMVEAILNGKKTMTRRVIKFPKGTTGRLPSNGFFNASPYLFYPGGIKHPRYKVGDVLYVREKYCTAYDGEAYFYFADKCTNREQNKLLNYDDAYWRPSIHMPKEAARIFLKVTNVRVERLQEITPLDAWNEGCHIGNSFGWEEHIPELQQMCRDVLFRKLWDSINAKRGYSWDSNPWVWVYKFERCEKPIEEVKE